ncbi:D-arabinono-1,4-lactone oxidase [Nostoc sp.]|uniref:D-arabinono-1,4-lactone oxidase n=1 Tax=Nostoc sp. TaxID=1180 RepID=UPI002FF4CF7C
MGKQQIWKNWWENHTCTPEHYYQPEQIDEVVEIIKSANLEQKQIKVIGSGRSWSDIPCTDGYMISLDKFNQVLDIDIEQKTVIVKSGIRIYQLVDILAKHGLALSSLGSICEQTIAGAISTGTHGNSLHQGGLASSILELELVNGIGEVIKCSKSKNPDLFSAALIGLGAIGIITQVKIQCCNQFWLTETLQCWNIKDVLENLDTLKKNDYCRFWYTTTNKDAIVQTFSDSKTPEKTGFIHFIKRIITQIFWFLWISWHDNPAEHDSQSFTRKDESQHILCYPRFFLKLYKLSFRMTKYCQNVLISEYGIPEEMASITMNKILSLVDRGIIKGHLRFEVRFGAAEDVWLSTAYQRPTCYIQVLFEKKNFTSTQDQNDAFIQVENIIKNLAGRPHWAKDHLYTNDDLRSTYPRWQEFLQIRQQTDPRQCFTNSYLNKIFDDIRRTA